MSDSPRPERPEAIQKIADRIMGLIARSYAHSRTVKGDDASEGVYFRRLCASADELADEIDRYIAARIEAATKPPSANGTAAGRPPATTKRTP